jgi:hypothetical protein
MRTSALRPGSGLGDDRFRQFSVLAASLNEGLDPKLRRPYLSVRPPLRSRRLDAHDGLIQAGPRPDSGVIASRVTVTPVSRELVRPVAAPKPEMHKLSKINPQRDRNAYLCKLSREIWVTEKSCVLLSSARALGRHPCEPFRIAAIRRPRSARMLCSRCNRLSLHPSFDRPLIFCRDGQISRSFGRSRR